MTADGAVLLVALPRGAGYVAADDTLERDHLQLLDKHRASLEFLVALEGFGVFVYVGGDDVVLHDILRETEPEHRESVEDFALAVDRGGHYYVVGGDAVGGDDEELSLARVEYLSYFAFKEFVVLHFFIPFKSVCFERLRRKYLTRGSCVYALSVSWSFLSFASTPDSMSFLKSSSFAARVSSERASICAASIAAFCAPSMATVATGMPPGI